MLVLPAPLVRLVLLVRLLLVLHIIIIRIIMMIIVTLIIIITILIIRIVPLVTSRWCYSIAPLCSTVTLLLLYSAAI
jgi:hypothetical protein